jgi:DNA-directed RNA polymerase II subunit RPB1
VSPSYSPASKSYSPASPSYSPASPSYSPVSHSNKELGGSPAFYSPRSRGLSREDSEAEENSHPDSPPAAGTLIALPESFEDLLLRWTKLGLNEVEAL